MSPEIPGETSTGPLDWAIAARCLPGEVQSGDAAVVLDRPDGALIAVVDGLGHGNEAAAAAAAAIDAVSAHRHESAEAIFQRCHEQLRKTRGVAMSLAIVDHQGTLTWGGIGNVEGNLVRARDGRREAILLRGGIVGYSMPPIRLNVHSIAPGDLLVFVTDGLQSRYTGELGASGAIARLAEQLLAGHARPTDDALVLVARHRGEAR